MKNKNNKISRKKFLDLLKSYNEFDLNDISILEDTLEDSTKVLNIKGHIKAYMKQNKSNNNDKLDLILNKISDMQIQINDVSVRLSNLENKVNNLEVKVDNGFKEVNSRIDNLEKRLDKLEKCPTIMHELLKLN